MVTSAEFGKEACCKIWIIFFYRFLKPGLSYEGPTEIEPETNFNLSSYALFLDGKVAEFGRRPKTDSDYFLCKKVPNTLTKADQMEVLQQVMAAQMLAEKQDNFDGS